MHARLAGDNLIVIGHASGSMVMGDAYGSIGWLCDSVVMPAEKGGTDVQAVFYK